VKPKSAIVALLVTVLVLASFAFSATAFAAGKKVKPALNLDHGANGSSAAAVEPVRWTDEELTLSNAHYTEGQSIPYRIVFTGLNPGATYSVEISFFITKNGKHAVDFLTSVDRIGGSVNPCAGISVCEEAPGFSIPDYPVSPSETGAYFNKLEAFEGNQMFSAYNSVITGAFYTASGDENSAGDSSARIFVNFRPLRSTAVMAWGAHIASWLDWGSGNTAAGLANFPYRVSLATFERNDVGAQTHRANASAVAQPPENGTLTVVKVVVNNDGGTKQVSDFRLFVNGAQVTSGQTLTLAPGQYTVSESADAGYAASFSASCAGGIVTVASGANTTCTITNDDVVPPATGTLVVNSLVLNDDGGTYDVPDFILFAGDTHVVDGVPIVLDVGTYAISQSGPAGYATSFLLACLGTGTVTIAEGETTTCNVVNDDIAPEFIIVTHVINDNGGLLTSENFMMLVAGTDVSIPIFPGEENGLAVTLDAGVYSVDEADSFGYAKTFGPDCSGTIGIGEVKTCVITNDDPAP